MKRVALFLSVGMTAFASVCNYQRILDIPSKAEIYQKIREEHPYTQQDREIAEKIDQNTKQLEELTRALLEYSRERKKTVDEVIEKSRQSNRPPSIPIR